MKIYKYKKKVINEKKMIINCYFKFETRKRENGKRQEKNK
jgi:hypothetical protein